MGRSGIRADWSELPERVRADVDAMLGAPVVRAENLPGGFSPGPAARCDLADGRVVFVKAAGPELNPDTPRLHRQEAEVLSVLPPDHPSPRLIGVVDDGDWIALATEWIDGRMPTPPLAPTDVARMFRLCERVAAAGAGVRPPGVPSWNESGRALVGHWSRLVDDSGLLSRLDDWSRRHLDRLVELDAMALDAGAGDHLIHLDFRTDNVLLADEAGGDVVVDWPSATIGAEWIDLVAMLPALHLDGGPRPSECFDRHPFARRADDLAVTAFIAGIAGYFTRGSLLPAPRGLPTLRAFQAAQGRIAREWLAGRI